MENPAWLTDLHLDVEIPLLVQLLHLEVEGDVLELEQAGPPERPPVVVVQGPGVLDLLLVGEGVGHVVVPALRPEDVRGEVGDADLLVTGPVGAGHQSEPAGLLVGRDGVDITALVTARLPEVAGMLDLLYDGGRHLAHTVGHRHPAGRTHLQHTGSVVSVRVEKYN